MKINLHFENEKNLHYENEENLHYEREQKQPFQCKQLRNYAKECHQKCGTFLVLGNTEQFLLFSKYRTILVFRKKTYIMEIYDTYIGDFFR